MNYVPQTSIVRQRELVVVSAARTVPIALEGPLLHALTMINELLATTPDCDLLAWR